MKELRIAGWLHDDSKLMWPPLHGLQEAAKLCQLDPARLQALVDAQAVPYLRIDEGEPLFYMPDLKLFVKQALVRLVHPRNPIPEPVAIYVDALPPARAIPPALRDYADHLVSLPIEPPMCGVYFLLANDQIKYVGSTTNVRNRLATHWGNGRRWDRVLFMATLAEERLRVESGFIRALRPEWNRVGVKDEAVVTDDQRVISEEIAPAQAEDGLPTAEEQLAAEREDLSRLRRLRIGREDRNGSVTEPH